MKIVKFLILACVLNGSYAAAVYSLEHYEVNIKPLQKYPDIAFEFQTLHDKFQKQPLSNGEHQRRIDIGNTLSRKAALEGSQSRGVTFRGYPAQTR